MVKLGFKNNETYEKYGIDSRKRGILLTRPPEVGKTFLAKVFADEVDGKLFASSGAELRGFAECGTGVKRVINMFKEAQKAVDSVMQSLESFL